MTGRARAAAGWVVGALLAGFVAGPWAALAAALTAIVVIAGWVRSRVLGWVAVGLVAAAPALWLLANWPRLGTVNPDLVTQAPWPSRFVAMGLVVATGALAARGSAGDHAGARPRGRDEVADD